MTRRVLRPEYVEPEPTTMHLMSGRVVDRDQWVNEVNVAVDMIGKLIMLHGGLPSTAHRVAAEFYMGLGL